MADNLVCHRKPTKLENPEGFPRFSIPHVKTTWNARALRRTLLPTRLDRFFLLRRVCGVSMANRDLGNARVNKKDEFYTQLSDIEKELRHYTVHFLNQVVYCNCDDPRVSNFFRYFSLQFTALGLKKLISTCYMNKQMDLFSQNTSEEAIYLEYEGTRNSTGIPSAEEIGIHNLEGNGDFRSQECIELLKQADIVVTNPPFSLFREYIAQLMEYDKKFLVIGNMNAVTTRDIFPLIQKNRIWYGVSIKSGDRELGVPEDYPLTAATSRIDNDGNKFVRVKGIRWFTNLDHKKRHEELILYKHYSPEEYPKYDNYDAINVDKTKDIPLNYEGAMGVPISFLDKHNPDQFEIIGLCWLLLKEMGAKESMFKIDGKRKYRRIVIRNKRLQK